MIGKSISFRAVVSGCSAAVFIVKQKNSQTLVNKGFASFLTWCGKRDLNTQVF